MKIVAIIPIKSNSERVPGKNFRLVNGKPLYSYMIEKAIQCNFDAVYVDTDSHEITQYCKEKKVCVIKRVPDLAKNDANGNDLLNYHASIIEADLYFQLFVTAPLLKVESINACISILQKNQDYDSVMTVEEIYSWFWFNNKPVNYNPKNLPRSQDANPIIVETTGLYGIRKSALLQRHCRIGDAPYFFKISGNETIDLDDESDFILLDHKLNA
jgi:N-acylneuraminate cytidylyltransferase